MLDEAARIRRAGIAEAERYRRLVSLDAMAGTDFERHVADLCLRDGLVIVRSGGGAGDAVGSVLRARGVTPERVYEQIARMAAGSAPARELDERALEAIGIDLEAVRTRIEAAFGPGSLERRTTPARRGRSPKRSGNLLPSGHLRVTHQARRCLNRAIRTTGPHAAEARDTAAITLALLAAKASAMRAILTALGTSTPQLLADVGNAVSQG